MQTQDLQATRECVRDLHMTLVKVNDSLHVASITLRDQTFALESALRRIRKNFDEANKQREAANNLIRRLYAAVGMEYDELLELPGMERAHAMASRRMRESEY